MEDSPYYSNSEARKVLGNITASQLKSYIERGTINKYVPPGKKYGMYLKSEVDALAEKNKRFYKGMPALKEEFQEDGRLRAAYGT